VIDTLPPIALQPGLYGLRLPLTMQIGSVNVYLIEGDPLTLIDSGTADDQPLAALAAGLSALGYRIADLRRLIITHHHVDHSGGAGRIAEMVRAGGGTLEILAHRRAVPHLESPMLTRRTISLYADRVFGLEGGASAEARARMIQADDYLLRRVTPVLVSGTLAEGDSIMLGGDRWQVLHNPGHAADQITFFQPASRMWIAADHLLGDSKSNPLLEPPAQPGDPRVPRLIEYERELQRIDALDPAIAYPGHGDPILAVRPLIAERIARRQARTAKLFDLVQQVDPLDRTLVALAPRLFPNSGRYDEYLIYSETLGHLDFLVQDGRIVPTTRADGAIEWQPGFDMG